MSMEGKGFYTIIIAKRLHMAYDKYDDLWDWEKKPRMEVEKEESIHV